VPNAGKRLLEIEAKFLISPLERLLTRDGNDILRATKWFSSQRERAVLVINVVIY
jgi:hypothetical protein